MTFQTGCSSSLVGFHEACQALQTGDCSSAIVAGSNLILSPTMTTASPGMGDHRAFLGAYQGGVWSEVR
ncbi:hypothetical protein BDV12DRAFT_163263 [Aspergillus spectabilis]